MLALSVVKRSAKALVAAISRTGDIASTNVTIESSGWVDASVDVRSVAGVSAHACGSITSTMHLIVATISVTAST